METFLLPSHWASALINEDYSGLEDNDEQCLDEWHFYNASGKHCVSVSESSEFTKYHDASSYGVLATDCSVFTFL